MKLFKKKPIIIEGHTFSEYLSRYGREYIMGRGEILKDVNKLKPFKRYWHINGEYYQVGFKKELRIAFIAISSLSLIACIILPIYFCVIAPMERYHDYNFTYWNNCESLNKLKEFVKDSVTPSNTNYVPQNDRIATFDMDGTLFGERSQIYLEWMMYNDYYDYLVKNKPSDIRLNSEIDVPNESDAPGADPTVKITAKQVYDAIEYFENTRECKDIINEGTKVVSLEFGEAYLGASLFSTLSIDEYYEIVDNMLEKDAVSFNNLKNCDMFYKPMIEVVNFLLNNNYNVYIVSGTDRFLVRSIISRHLEIPYYRIIGMDVELEVDQTSGEVVRTGNLIVKNVKEAKVTLITQEIGKRPILSFGNSSGDIAMHDFTISKFNKYHSQAYMVLADDNEREYAQAKWESQKNQWNEKGYNIFSMKDDFKTIYGDNVTKNNK